LAGVFARTLAQVDSSYHLTRRSPEADPFLYEIVYFPQRNFGGNKGNRGRYNHYRRAKRSAEFADSLGEEDSSIANLKKRSPVADPILFDIEYFPPNPSRNFNDNKEHSGGYSRVHGKRSLTLEDAFGDASHNTQLTKRSPEANPFLFDIFAPNPPTNVGGRKPRVPLLSRKYTGYGEGNEGNGENNGRGSRLTKRSPDAYPFLYEIVYFPPRNLGGVKGGYGHGKRSADPEPTHHRCKRHHHRCRQRNA